MYVILILRLYQTKVARLEAVTDLASPLVYAGVEVRRGTDGNSILINGKQYHVPKNDEGVVKIDDIIVSFGYYTDNEESID
jgi:hypothetical protein